MEQRDYDTFLLPMEDGSEQEYAILDDFTAGEGQYLLVSPVYRGRVSEEEFELYRYREENGDLIVECIEDDGEFERARAAYEALIQD